MGPKHPVNPSPSQNQRMFGDTLTKKMDPRLKPSPISASTQNLNNSKIRMQKLEAAQPSNPVKPNMSSYVLRRERTFDMTLISDMGNRRKEEMKPKFSPQFQRKNRQLTTQERYKANLQPPPAVINNQVTSNMPQSAISKQRPTVSIIKSHEKMKTIDRKNIKKKPAENSVEQLFADVKNAKGSKENSVVSNTANSVSSSFNYVKGPAQNNGNNSPTNKSKQPEILIKPERSLNTPTNFSREQRESPLHIQQQQQQQPASSNFYYELKETPVDSETNDDKNEVNHAQMDMVNKFAEDILKMSTFDVSQTEGEFY